MSSEIRVRTMWKKAAAHASLTLAELAQTAGLSKASLYHRGENPTLDTLKAIAGAAGVSVSKLVEWGEE